MKELVQKTARQRNTVAESSMRHMQTLAKIESQLSQAYTEIKGLELPQDQQQAMDMLNVIARLPHVYGHLLIEAVRRQEWAEKIRKDTSTLAEEVATYQAEEERRRRKWFNTIDDVASDSVLAPKTLGMEVNLQANEEAWPIVTRQTLTGYIDSLRVCGIAESTVNDLLQAIRALDQPTRKQVKHAKTFKNGSMHEAAFGLSLIHI